MTTEERVRLAIEATAAQVSPGSISPLDLERDGRAARQGGGETAEASSGQFRWARARRWLAPVAAAASLCAIASGLALAGFGHGTQPAHRGPSLPGHVPPYYVALQLVQPHAQEGPTRAVVTATATGAALATVSVPKPYAAFDAVLAAADDRTFVLVAHLAPTGSHGYPYLPASRFFRLTIDPAARNRAGRAHLAPLPVPAEPSNTVFRSALSPDGSKLAVLALRWPHAPARVGPPRLSVFNLLTGTERTWRGPRGFGIGEELSWLADNRTLALAGAPYRAYRWQVLLLDTNAPGASFAADARIAARITSAPRLTWRQVTITPDGRTLLVVRETPIPNGWPITGTVRLQKYDVRTGRVIGLVDARKVELGEYDEVQWSSLSGRVLIALVPRHPRVPGPGVNTDRRTVIIVGRRFYDIPWSRRAIGGAW